MLFRLILLGGYDLLKHVGPNKDDVRALIREIYSSVDYCVNHLVNTHQKLIEFSKSQKMLVERVDDEMGSQPIVSKKEFIGAMLGIQQPDNVVIKPPKGNVNKGGDRKTRMKSSREKSINKTKSGKKGQKSKGGIRLCSYCNEMIDHDIRTCPVRF